MYEVLRLLECNIEILFVLRRVIHAVWTDFPHTSTPLDLVKAPQQIIATLRRLEQVQGLGQNSDCHVRNYQQQVCMEAIYHVGF